MDKLFFKRKVAQSQAQRNAEKELCVPLRLTFALLCVSLFIFLLPLPVQAQSERTPLTVELLQERLHTPTLHEGNLTVDLRQMVIDLRPENALFRDVFYQLLRKELQKAGAKPLGLDLSYSLIQGDFLGSDLGLRTPLYAQAIARTFTPIEQEQLERLRFVCMDALAIGLPNPRDCRSLLGNQPTPLSEITVFRSALTIVQTRFNGEVQFPNTFFLQPVDAQGAIFTSSTNWNETRFSRRVSFIAANFRQPSNFKSSIFFEKATFKQAQFQESAYFQNSIFLEVANFNAAIFKQLAKFTHVQWQGNADFSNVRFSNAQFTQASFYQLLLLTEATFEQAVTFREAQFNQTVNLQGASILNSADFSDAGFAASACLNVSGLTFNSNSAKILGNVGEIGKMLCVPTLQGNQNVLRNLGQNFRQQQQIADANQVEYTKQRLRLTELSRRLVGININNSSLDSLLKIGFTATQADAIIRRRQVKKFRNKTELLALPEIDVETYNQVNSRFVVGEVSFIEWLLKALNWLCLSVLLLFSGYGTSVGLVFGVGGVAIAYFGLLFWLIDRYRRLLPVAIIPNINEITSMLTSFSVVTLCGLIAIFRSGEQPWLTLGCLLIIIIPVPIALVFRLYQKGRYHDLMDVSYFTEDGTFRQLRLLIGRLPVIPRNPTFRERYMPLLWNRRWNWLNYFDFSLNNLVKLGFNDIRLRDEHLPGIISTLAWYHWSLGLLYITLLLWTLSRTIPGLNLLIYLK